MIFCSTTKIVRGTMKSCKPLLSHIVIWWLVKLYLIKATFKRVTQLNIIIVYKGSSGFLFNKIYR